MNGHAPFPSQSNAFPSTPLGTGPTGPAVRGAPGRFFVPPPRLGVTSSGRQIRSEARRGCRCGSAGDLGIMWYVRGCSRVAESGARGGRAMALAPMRVGRDHSSDSLHSLASAGLPPIL